MQHPKDIGLKFARTIKRKKRPPRPSGPPEGSIQAGVEYYLKLHKIRFVHIPDCVYRRCSFNSPAPIWEKREISKYLKGVPDLLIFEGDKHLILELKRKNGKLRQPQRNWLKGIKHYVPDTLREALEIIEKWRKNDITTGT